jgi:hypothetical protein
MDPSIPAKKPLGGVIAGWRGYQNDNVARRRTYPLAVLKLAYAIAAMRRLARRVGRLRKRHRLRCKMHWEPTEEEGELR